jgi:hypothetical protein
LRPFGLLFFLVAVFRAENAQILFDLAFRRRRFLSALGFVAVRSVAIGPVSAFVAALRTVAIAAIRTVATRIVRPLRLVAAAAIGPITAARILGSLRAITTAGIVRSWRPFATAGVIAATTARRSLASAISATARSAFTSRRSPAVAPARWRSDLAEFLFLRIRQHAERAFGNSFEFRFLLRCQPQFGRVAQHVLRERIRSTRPAHLTAATATRTAPAAASTFRRSPAVASPTTTSAATTAAALRPVAALRRERLRHTNKEAERGEQMQRGAAKHNEFSEVSLIENGVEWISTLNVSQTSELPARASLKTFAHVKLTYETARA